jgi:hypothetical protein
MLVAACVVGVWCNGRLQVMFIAAVGGKILDCNG